MDKALKVLQSLEKMGVKHSISSSDIKRWGTIENAAKNKQFISSIGPIKGKIIENIIKRHKPKRILEIGTLFGYSAILMARLLPKSGKVVTIEKNEDNAETARRNIISSRISNKIRLISGDALKILPKMTEKFDMIFIDAQKEEYLDYLKITEKNLKKGSLVVADNTGIFKKRLFNYLNYVRSSGNYNSRSIKTLLEFSRDIEDAIEISVRIK